MHMYEAGGGRRWAAKMNGEVDGMGGAHNRERSAVGVEGVGEEMAAALIRRVWVTVGDPRRQRVAYRDRLPPPPGGVGVNRGHTYTQK